MLSINHPNFEKELCDLILQEGILKKYTSQSIVANKGDYKDYTVFILDGLLKVTLGKETNNLLLYHISKEDNSVLTFMNIFTNTPIQIAVTALQESTLLFVSNTKILKWSSKFDSLEQELFKAYHKNNKCLLQTVKNVMTNSLEQRLFEYIKNKTIVYNDSHIHISRNEIASDLYASKEAISRTIKKLENDNKIIRKSRSIILNSSNIF